MVPGDAHPYLVPFKDHSQCSFHRTKPMVFSYRAGKTEFCLAGLFPLVNKIKPE